MLRIVALFASHRSSKEFNDFWPLNDDEVKEVPSWAASSLKLREQILEKQRKQNERSAT